MREYFELDKNKLDEEWVEQPKWYSTVAHQLAGAREQQELAKATIKDREVAAESIRGMLDLEVRANPGLYGLEKVREESVKNCVAMDPKYLKAVQDIRDAEMELIKINRVVGDLGADIGTLDNRKKALEKLVDLFLANYFSEPRVSGAAGEKMRDKEVAAGFKKGKSKER
jgi:hypothetical protein